MSLKSMSFLIVMVFFASSCLAVKFPSEIKVSLDIPANLSDENVSKLIDKIPEKIGKKDVKIFVAVPNGSSSIFYVKHSFIDSYIPEKVKKLYGSQSDISTMLRPI